MKKYNYYVIDDYDCYCYGGTMSLDGAKRKATYHSYGFHIPNIYKVEDVIFTNRMYDGEVVPKKGKLPFMIKNNGKWTLVNYVPSYDSY